MKGDRLLLIVLVAVVTDPFEYSVVLGEDSKRAQAFVDLVKDGDTWPCIVRVLRVVEVLNDPCADMDRRSAARRMLLLVAETRVVDVDADGGAVVGKEEAFATRPARVPATDHW